MFLHFFQQFHLSNKSLTPNNHSSSNSSSFNLFFNGSHHIISYSYVCTTLYAFNLKTTRGTCVSTSSSSIHNKLYHIPTKQKKNFPFPPHPIRKKKRRKGFTLLICEEESHLICCCCCCWSLRKNKAETKACGKKAQVQIFVSTGEAFGTKQPN